jgi:hypothetical protein
MPAKYLVTDPFGGQHGELAMALAPLEGLKQPRAHQHVQRLLSALRAATHHLDQWSGG